MTERPITFPIQCGGIVCQESRIAEIDAGRVMAAAERKEIESITLRFGKAAPHPILQVIAGGLLSLLGYFPAMHLIHWFIHGGVFIDIESLLLTFPAIGLWMIFTAFRQKFFLDIQSNSGRKRMTFNGDVDLLQIDAFATAVKRSYGIVIQRDASVL